MKIKPANRIAKVLAREKSARKKKSLLAPFPGEGSAQGEFRGRMLSLSDLEIPVRKLLSHEEEIQLGRKIQNGFRRLRLLLPLCVEGYERYLQEMTQVAIGAQVVVGWFHLREGLDRDLETAAAQLQEAKRLAALAFRKESGPTAEEEKAIRRVLDSGVEILRRFPLDPEMLFSWSRELGLGRRDPGPLSRLERDEKVVRLINRNVATIELARDRLVLPNFRLILKDALRYNPLGMKRSDLFQEGILGLHRAVFRFDPERKTRFSTYATYWIRQAIRKALIDRSRLIRVPQAVQEELRNPKTKMAPEEVRRVRTVMGETLSMSAGEEDDPRDRLSFEAVRPAAPAHGEAFYTGTIPEAIDQALKSLSTREREVLRRRFGIGGDRVQTLEEIGVAMHLSRERIRQIEREALAKMKRQDSLQAVYEEME
ncbi:MAG: sigma-70 family RNA polymerase sigma factor [Planctomycetes bacterium]|nr:sigma-70 family RNA polymerase sigma factor [Planctomycetota bacterium]